MSATAALWQSARLPQERATDIVQRFVDGYPISDIARYYGVSRLTVEHVIRGGLRQAVTMLKGTPCDAPDQ